LEATVEIIFVRHSNAETIGVEQKDFDRKLTEKGIKKTKKIAKGLKKIFNSDIFEIWTSPAQRASQTSKIIADSLKCENIKEMGSLWEGDFIKFLHDLKDIDETVKLICVGHQPTLTDWVKSLTGSVVPFKKCSCLSITTDPKNPQSGTLNWLFDVKFIEKILDI
jgi:phosphohistidine phosphatase